MGLYVKLQILQTIGNELAKLLLERLPTFAQYETSIKNWDYHEFVKNHSREHVEIMILFFREKLPRESPMWRTLAEANFKAARTLQGAEE